MQLLNLLAPLVLLAQHTAAEATASPTLEPLPTPSGQDALDSTRQGNLGINILGIAVSVAGEILKIFKDDNDRKREWVKETLIQLAKEAPGQNVLIYHDKKSEFSTTDKGARAEHYELDKFLGTYGYEIKVFTMGSFKLHGDNNAKEWGYNAACKDEKKSDFVGGHVEFCDPNTKNKQTQPPTSTLATSTKRQSPVSSHTSHITTSKQSKPPTVTPTQTQEHTTGVQSQTPDAVTTQVGGEGSGNNEGGPSPADGQGQGQGQSNSDSSPTSTSRAGVPKATSQPASAAAALAVGLAALSFVIA
ncbi:hypothetical protein PG999_002904 [Apiospora kogelbergensis]|uniref:Uncharacterized protein n=1 Tax=Apiospora kogelbergensis TaxID=1337665 RepID=A0AAW0R9G7_9PEZI